MTRSSGVRYLLDVNVLVALAFPDHQLNTRAHSWFRRESGREWATCALTQAGFLRVGSRLLGGSRVAVREALAGLERNCRSPHHDYWPVDTDLSELSDSMRSRLIGLNQVTDMQLLMLAHRHKGQLATFDAGIRELAAGTRYASSLLTL
jgi:uncharacterized protein